MEKFITEEEWLKLTPAERLKETDKLRELYITLEGDLDPGPDPQSPFHFQEFRSKKPAYRQTGKHSLRSR